jgi:hypothetical protein
LSDWRLAASRHTREEPQRSAPNCSRWDQFGLSLAGRQGRKNELQSGPKLLASLDLADNLIRSDPHGGQLSDPPNSDAPTNVTDTAVAMKKPKFEQVSLAVLLVGGSFG